MSTCDYDGIARFYELWSRGDDSFFPVANFYLNYFKGVQGVLAELGVGTGRIAIPLSKRPNILVYGVDLSQEMLRCCKEKMKESMNICLINSNFLDFSLPQKADVIYMPFRTIGHVLSREDMHKLFKSVNENLRVKGLFIFDHYMFSKTWAINHNDIDMVMYKNKKINITNRFIYDFENSIMHCTVKCNDEEKFKYDFRWIEVNEINEIYPEHGFSLDSLYGNFDKSQWTLKSPNQIWVLRKCE
jgi:D-alanine-D-alanine ligase